MLGITVRLEPCHTAIATKEATGRIVGRIPVETWFDIKAINARTLYRERKEIAVFGVIDGGTRHHFDQGLKAIRNRERRRRRRAVAVIID